MTDINLKGGKLSIEQLNTIFETIPVEFDFVDENHSLVISQSASFIQTN